MSDGAEPGANVATFSSGMLPSRDDGTVRPPIACSVDRFCRLRAQVHLVLLAAFVVGRHLIAADQQPQRFRRIADLHAEVGRLRPIDLHRQLRLAEFSDVSRSTTPGNVFDLVDQLLAEDCPACADRAR